MAPHYILAFILIVTQNLLHCTSAAVHSHNIDNMERESDGSFRPRDSEHYSDSGHNMEFDHEAILGSVKEAEEFDRLSPEEAKQRLALLLKKMDLNNDEYIDRTELKKWILNSFISLSNEEAEERMSEADGNRDGVVTWNEYLQDAFGVDDEVEIGPEDTGETGMVGLLKEEKLMWMAADKNGDGELDENEFAVFSNPEDHEYMHPFLINQTLREKDRNNDGVLDFEEYLGDRGTRQDQDWLLSEKDKFEHELDINKDGYLDVDEIRAWVIPDNDEIAEEEVEHLFATADGDGDGRLAAREVLAHHHVFVGSEATDYGDQLLHERYYDEL